MRVAVDTCISPKHHRLLVDSGHTVVVSAESGESDTSWFERALLAGVEAIISPDADLSILAYDANIVFFRPKKGESSKDAVQRFCRRWPAR